MTMKLQSISIPDIVCDPSKYLFIFLCKSEISYIIYLFNKQWINVFQLFKRFSPITKISQTFNIFSSIRLAFPWKMLSSLIPWEEKENKPNAQPQFQSILYSINVSNAVRNPLMYIASNAFRLISIQVLIHTMLGHIVTYHYSNGGCCDCGDYPILKKESFCD